MSFQSPTYLIPEEWIDDLEPLPTYEHFRHPGADLDSEYARKNFEGLSRTQALVKFRDCPFTHQEDFLWMSPPAFLFYFPVIERYLYEFDKAEPTDFSPLASCIANAISSQLSYLRKLHQKGIPLVPPNSAESQAARMTSNHKKKRSDAKASRKLDLAILEARTPRSIAERSQRLADHVLSNPTKFALDGEEAQLLVKPWNTVIHEVHRLINLLDP